MWFRNLTLYMIPGFPLSGDDLAAALARSPWQPCQSYSDRSSGWTPVRNDGYVYSIEGEHMIALKLSRKVLPGAVVKEEVARQCAEFEKEHGHKPGKKTRKELKEKAYDDLLPKAFEVSRDVRVWISPKRGLLAIDTSSKATADVVIRSFIRSAETPFSIYPAGFALDPASAMTEWVADEPPTGFTVDADSTILSSRSGGTASIKYSGVSLEADDARKQIEGGRVVTTLALTWDDKASFILTGAGRIKRLLPVGITKASAKDSKDDDVFASDFLLMTGTVGDLLAELADALNGFAKATDLFSEVKSEAEEAEDAEREGDADPLVGEAQRIVLAEGRASISLVQRHLRIGYNRAARLLDALEAGGVVSAMDSRGQRTITGAQA